jgi:hypothetical protein
MKGFIVTALALAVLVVGIRWGTFVAGGSDSYCYVHQAEGWATLRLQTPEPLVVQAPWPTAALTFAPAGHLPSPTFPGAIVPICPAGLSMAMGLFQAAGGRRAVFFVVPLFGALLVVATYVAGARFGAPVGLASAALAGASPVFLYQLVQPMSDVPAAALWMMAVAVGTGTSRNAPALAGLASGAAIVVRPNLVPLAIPIGMFLLLRPERSWPERLRAAALYAACAVPGCLAVAVIQQLFYGSPLSSGYGSFEELFAVNRAATNASRYLSWMTQAHTPLWVGALASVVLLPGALTALFLALFLMNLAVYLPYIAFDDWSYARFLLPTIPLVLILLVASIDAAWRRFVLAGPQTGTRSTHVGLVMATLVLAILFVGEAVDRSVFRLQRLEARYERAGLFVDRRLPADAIVITSWQSGSVRYYAGRKTLVWDSLDPSWLDRAVAFVQTNGFEPFLLFERWEEPLFRQRFAVSPLGALDWPPMAEIASQVRIYRPGDRERYLRGEQEPTEYAR